MMQEHFNYITQRDAPTSLTLHEWTLPDFDWKCCSSSIGAPYYFIYLSEFVSVSECFFVTANTARVCFPTAMGKNEIYIFIALFDIINLIFDLHIGACVCVCVSD